MGAAFGGNGDPSIRCISFFSVRLIREKIDATGGRFSAFPGNCFLERGIRPVIYAKVQSVLLCAL